MNLSNEIELMIACARVAVDRPAEEKIQVLAGEITDWDGFVKLCMQHKVLSLVFQNLSVIGEESFPGALKTELEDNYLFENAVNNLSLVEQLFSILEVLKKNDIAAVPFKGPVLAGNVFGDSTIRRSIDLDLFVSKKDMLQAVETLMDRGFETLDGPLPEGAKKKAYLEMLTAVSLILPSKRITIDLQWDIANRFLNVPIVLEDMKDRVEQVKLNQRDVPNLPPEELLCYLCLHGTKHRWLYLDLVCCISEFVRVRKDIDWEYLWDYAERMHCRRVLLLGLFLAQDILGASLPENIGQKIDQDKQVKVLGSRACEGLYLNYIEGTMMPEKFGLFLFQVKDGWVDKIRYGCRILFLPTKEDLRCFALPSVLFFLLYGLRPLRLMGAYGKRWFGK